MIKPILNDVENIIALDKVSEKDTLSVVDSNKLGVDIKRVFVITDVPKNEVRGGHAHKTLNQFLMCPKGKIEIKLDDGTGSISCTLEDPYEILPLPAGVWSTQKYLTDDAVLIVYCDQPYDEGDYFREYGDFQEWVKNSRSE